ncbi:hypothetical protein D3C85_590350 [compost metagenome]
MSDKLREEILKTLRDGINRLVWTRGMSTSSIRRQLFRNPELQLESTSLITVRNELRAMEIEGLVTADRRMRNVTAWTLTE